MPCSMHECVCECVRASVFCFSLSERLPKSDLCKRFIIYVVELTALFIRHLFRGEKKNKEAGRKGQNHAFNKQGKEVGENHSPR